MNSYIGRIAICALATAMPFLACNQAKNKSGLGAIIGKDNRTSGSNNSYLNLIGQIKVAETTCNAFASGPNEITTAAHCVAINQIPETNQISFRSASGKSYEITEITLLDAKKDLARLSSKESFATWLQSAPLQGGRLTLTAVDPQSGQVLSDRDCSYEQAIPAAGVFLHTCDSVPGESGAPILQDGKVVGVQLGYKKSVDRNVAFDLQKAHDETVDVLSLDYKKEGCHSRAHIRGTHARAHVRDCMPDLKPDFSWAIKAIAKPISDHLANQASQEGWTKNSCENASASAVAVASALYGTAICAAATLAAPACLGFLASSGSLIVAVTCNQLCTDKHLADCK